ncbi:E3 ubiquitin-protein ligase TTC3 [Mytilus galloprovincialis]|nr:E3 ubiquitin-protein ligase TTC3 [Mytilus galloprovincialis]
MKSLEHLNDNMSDSDSDVPALVPSSDEEDDVKVIKTNDECVDIWLSKNVKFLEKQEHNIHIFSLGPFIMGLETFISKPWMFCLNDAKLLVDKVYREKTEYSKLTDDEWANLDILDVVTKLVVKKMRRRKFLVNTLNMIDKIEEFNRGDGIDVKHSIQTATRYNHINDFVWDKALILPQLRDKQQKVKFAALYVCKLCHMVITSLAREGKDIAEDFKKSIRAKCGGVEKALDFKDQGNQQYSQQKYSEAIRLYTDAIKADHFNHLCYGNRAQAYQKLENYQEALADGRRAVLMKPDWIKGYYRYSQAFYHTGKIDMAIAINKKGMRICEKTKNNDKMLSELKDQGQKLQFQKDGVASDEVLHQMIKNNRMDDSVPEQIRNFPGCTVINIESAMSQWSQKRFSQDPSVLLSSDDHDSSGRENWYFVEPFSISKSLPNLKSQKGRKVNQTGERQTKPVATEPTPIPVQEKVKEKIVIVQKNENKEIERYMAEGSSAYLNGLGKKAVASYQKALDLLSNKKAEDFGLDQQDVAVLEYAYGLADISTGIYKHILDGIERLKNITETHKDIRLPLPYFGLGKAYITLNRFEEAIDPLNRCLRMAGTLKLNVLTWPGTDTKMEESISDELQKQVKQLLTLTKYPPVPDAVCKIHTDKEDSRALIFFSDPDFKGFVRIVCLTSCIVEFHNHCWKDFKSRYGEKTGDKDILEKPCPTPDCMSCIVKVIIIKQDSLQKEITADKTEHVASKPKKPALKLPPSSQDKIEKRKEKKELRKQRKRESKEEEANDLMDDIESVSALPTVNEQCSITSIEGIYILKLFI